MSAMDQDAPSTQPDKSTVARPYKCPYPSCGRAFSRLEHQVRVSSYFHARPPIHPPAVLSLAPIRFSSAGSSFTSFVGNATLRCLTTSHRVSSITPRHSIPSFPHLGVYDSLSNAAGVIPFQPLKEENFEITLHRPITTIPRDFPAHIYFPTDTPHPHTYRRETLRMFLLRV
jgi:hypothetical protein